MPPEIAEFMALLADPKVQKWLEQHVAEPSHKPAPQAESVSHYFDTRVGATREHIAALAAALPGLPNQFERAVGLLQAEIPTRGTVLLHLALFVALGFGAEWLFRQATRSGSDEGAKNWAMLASLIEDLQAARRQSGSLSDRRADQARQQLAQQPARRTYALGLGCRTLIVRCGEQNRTRQAVRMWPRLIAYAVGAEHRHHLCQQPAGEGTHRTRVWQLAGPDGQGAAAAMQRAQFTRVHHVLIRLLRT
jgi:hypothetical protein